jgi:hypothetical protein
MRIASLRNGGSGRWCQTAHWVSVAESSLYGGTIRRSVSVIKFSQAQVCQLRCHLCRSAVAIRYAQPQGSDRHRLPDPSQSRDMPSRHPRQAETPVAISPQADCGAASRHSRKPDETYERNESLCPGPYLELFGRFDRPGWNRWGNEDGIGARRWRSDKAPGEDWGARGNRAADRIISVASARLWVPRLDMRLLQTEQVMRRLHVWRLR